MSRNFLFLLLLIPFRISAQDEKADSLISALKVSVDDHSKIIILNELSRYYLNRDPETSINYSIQAENIFLHNSDSISALSAASYYYLSLANEYLGNHSASLLAGLHSMKISESIKDDALLLKSYNNLGKIYSLEENYSNSLSYYFKALKIAQSIEDKNRTASISNNIGGVYYMQGDYKSALNYFLSAAKIYSELTDPHSLASSYENVGVAYDGLEKTDSALVYFHKSENIYELIDEKNGLSICYSNIGNEELKKGNSVKALEYYNKSLKLNTEIGNKQGITNTNYKIGFLYAEKYSTSKNINDFNLAQDYFLKSLSTGNEIGDRYQQMKCDKALADLYAVNGNYKLAYEYTLNYISVKDSITTEENNKMISELQMKYDVDKKESQLKILELQNQLMKAKMEAEEKKKR